MFENKMRFKLILLCLNIKTINDIIFVFRHLLVSSSHTFSYSCVKTFRCWKGCDYWFWWCFYVCLFTRSKVIFIVIIVNTLIEQSLDRLDTLWLQIRYAFHSLKLCSVSCQTVQIVTKLRFWNVLKLPNKLARIFRMKKKNDLKGEWKFMRCICCCLENVFTYATLPLNPLPSSIFRHPKA